MFRRICTTSRNATAFDKNLQGHAIGGDGNTYAVPTLRDRFRGMISLRVAFHLCQISRKNATVLCSKYLFYSHEGRLGSPGDTMSNVGANVGRIVCEIWIMIGINIGVGKWLVGLRNRSSDAKLSASFLICLHCSSPFQPGCSRSSPPSHTRRH